MFTMILDLMSGPNHSRHKYKLLLGLFWVWVGLFDKALRLRSVPVLQKAWMEMNDAPKVSVGFGLSTFFSQIIRPKLSEKIIYITYESQILRKRLPNIFVNTSYGGMIVILNTHAQL